MRSPDAAIEVVLLAVADPPTGETVVLLLDQDQSGHLCLVVRGATTADQVVSVLPLLVQLAQDGLVGGVVVATVRPGAGIAVSPADHHTFLAMRTELDAAGAELFDWFLLDDELVASVAELTGAAWRWPAEEPPW